MKALVWSVATYCWTLRKNEETRLDAFEMKGLRKILWTAKKTNEWSKDIVKVRKLTYYCNDVTMPVHIFGFIYV